ncbi:hypothetical protein M378DRAFT_329114 [Amanita muscaria Koide BX008]|uniref:Secreted protein n=1 Tax=Amanita muscaria (strain Koide BX008) TaxID=946122 RepID=A0A0C2XCK3_AMAMK|nr:hypothetical protein M378DRAFT_329114 [Amanita muscaria Koide BX008]
MLISQSVKLACVLVGIATFSAAQTSAPCGVLPFDATCSTVLTACTTTLNDISNPWANEACVAAATCHSGRTDAFLADLSCRIQGPGHDNITATSLPRVPDAVYNNIAGGGNITYDAYKKWFTGVALKADPGVQKLIDIVAVITNFDPILAWTGFCSTGAIPKQNFLDWFQYSSIAGGPATTCGLIPPCPTFQYSVAYPYTIDLLVPCANEQNALSDPFSISVCVAAALNNFDGVDVFLEAVTCRYNVIFGTNHSAPASNTLPPHIAQTSPYSQQNFIDFTYKTLSSLQASVRWPASVDSIITQWSYILQWTNFCSAGTVPEKNLSDLLLYSHFRLGVKCPNVCTPDPNPGCETLFKSCLNSPVCVLVTIMHRSEV